MRSIPSRGRGVVWSGFRVCAIFLAKKKKMHLHSLKITDDSRNYTRAAALSDASLMVSETKSSLLSQGACL